MITNCPIVIHLILLILLLKSSKYNSEPAEKAIIAKAISFKKWSLSTASCGIKFKTEEPATIPVIINPVIKGNLIFWNTFEISFAEIATTKKPIKKTTKVFVAIEKIWLKS